MLKEQGPTFCGTRVSHDATALDGILLRKRDRRMGIRKQFVLGEGFGVVEMRVQRGHERRTFLNDPYARVAAPVDPTFVSFGTTEESLEVEIVVGQIRVVSADEKAGGERRHRGGHDLSHR